MDGGADFEATAEAGDEGGLDCQGELVLWPQGLCAPRVEECSNPWEMAVAGGGCAAVGPRACPALWDPESKAGCEPGELLACPEGFDESADGAYCVPRFDECGDMELPVLGGGCRPVGPRWEEHGLDGEPHFDDCASGELALLGGGCFRVGPRACPKLWAPEAVADCEVGDEAPCAEGWVESEDGMYCTPLYEECGPGTRPLLGGGCQRVVPLGSECPAGNYPPVPPGVEDAAYVSASSPCVEGCGTQEAPFPSIQAGIDSVAAGGAVLVGAGIYQESIVIAKPVRVIGLCAALVAVVGQEGMEGDGELPPGTVRVEDVTGVEIAGLTVLSAGPGMVVKGAGVVLVSQVACSGNVGTGLQVQDGQVVLDGCWLHGLKEALPEWPAVGALVVEGKSDVVAKNSLVEGSVGTGIAVSGPQAKLLVKGSAVRQTQASGELDSGVAMAAADGAELIVQQCLVEGYESSGILAKETANLSVSDSVVRTEVFEDSACSDGGVHVVAGGHGLVERSLIEGGVGKGVQCRGEGASLTLRSSVVRDVGASGCYESGVGVLVTESCSLGLSASVIERTHETGVLLNGPGVHGSVQGCLVRECGLEANELGRAIDLFSQTGEAPSSLEVSGLVADHNGDAALSCTGHAASAVAARCSLRDEGAVLTSTGSTGIRLYECGHFEGSELLVERNANGGVDVLLGSELRLEKSVIRNNKAAAEAAANDGEMGEGVFVGMESSLELIASVVEGNSSGGVVAYVDSAATLESVVVRDTVPVKAQVGGIGVQVADEAGGMTTAMVANCLLEGNTGFGLRTGGPVSASIVDTVVADTLGGEGYVGAGVGVQENMSSDPLGGSLEATGLLVAGTRGIAVAAKGTGSFFTAEDVALLAPQTAGAGEMMVGIAVEEGAAVSLSRVLIRRGTIGVAVGGEGADAALDDCMIRDTKRRPDGDGGYGLQVTEQATGTVSRCVIDGNERVGAIAGGEGAELGLRQSVVRQTGSDGAAWLSLGVHANNAAHLEADGCLIESNRGGGVSVAQPETTARLSGSIIRSNVPTGEGTYGVGLMVGQGSATVESCLLAGNQVFGLAAADSASVLVSDCEISATGKGMAPCEGTGCRGETATYGDGLLAESAQLDVESCIVTGNERAGVFFSRSEGSLKDSLIFENRSYGLALESCAEDVDWEGMGCWFVGNAYDLPPAYAAEVTTSPQGLPVPPPPELDLEEPPD